MRRTLGWRHVRRCEATPHPARRRVSSAAVIQRGAHDVHPQAVSTDVRETEGGEIAARLVTDAMPLSPMDPSFLDMRDALVSERTCVDAASNTGSYVCMGKERCASRTADGGSDAG
jgi:hypothetical protein